MHSASFGFVVLLSIIIIILSATSFTNAAELIFTPSSASRDSTSNPRLYTDSVGCNSKGYNGEITECLRDWVAGGSAVFPSPGGLLSGATSGNSITIEYAKGVLGSYPPETTLRFQIFDSETGIVDQYYDFSPPYTTLFRDWGDAIVRKLTLPVPFTITPSSKLMIEVIRNDGPNPGIFSFIRLIVNCSATNCEKYNDVDVASLSAITHGINYAPSLSSTSPAAQQKSGSFSSLTITADSVYHIGRWPNQLVTDPGKHYTIAGWSTSGAFAAFRVPDNWNALPLSSSPSSLSLYAKIQIKFAKLSQSRSCEHTVEVHHPSSSSSSTDYYVKSTSFRPENTGGWNYGDTQIYEPTETFVLKPGSIINLTTNIFDKYGCWNLYSIDLVPLAQLSCNNTGGNVVIITNNNNGQTTTTNSQQQQEEQIAAQKGEIVVLKEEVSELKTNLIVVAVLLALAGVVAGILGFIVWNGKYHSAAGVASSTGSDSLSKEMKMKKIAIDEPVLTLPTVAAAAAVPHHYPRPVGDGGGKSYLEGRTAAGDFPKSGGETAAIDEHADDIIRIPSAKMFGAYSDESGGGVGDPV